MHSRYSGQTTTGEMSGTQGVDFSSLGPIDFFPQASPQRTWLDAYSKGVDRFLRRAKQAEIDAYFFVDLLVFPTMVLKAWPNATSSDGKTILWNDASRQLLEVLVQEVRFLSIQLHPHFKSYYFLSRRLLGTLIVMAGSSALEKPTCSTLIFSNVHLSGFTKMFDFTSYFYRHTTRRTI